MRLKIHPVLKLPTDNEAKIKYGGGAYFPVDSIFSPKVLQSILYNFLLASIRCIIHSILLPFKQEEVYLQLFDMSI